MQLLAVSVDAKPELQRMVDRVSRDGRTPDFPFLSDPGHRVIGRYGVLNPDNPREIAHPTTLVIDRDGVVRWKRIELDYKVRPTNAEILDAVRAVRSR